MVDPTGPLASTKSSARYEPVTLEDADLPAGICRAIKAETAGRVNLMQEDGTVRENFPLIVGYNMEIAKQIRAPTDGAAAMGVWAIY